MKISLLFTLLTLASFKAFTAGTSDVREQIKKIEFDSELSEREILSANWLISATYSFHKLEAQNNNSFTTELLSEFSPGLNLTYIKDHDRTLSYRSFLSYQRVIFEQADINELESNTTDLYEVNIGADYHLNERFAGHLSLGYASTVYSEFVELGVASIEKLERPYIKMSLLSDLKKGRLKKDLAVSAEVSLSQFVEGKTDDGKFEANLKPEIILNFNKTVSHQNIVAKLAYTSYDYIVNGSSQKTKQIQLQIGMRFGD